jgi:hypothetical protein
MDKYNEPVDPIESQEPEQEQQEEQIITIESDKSEEKKKPISKKMLAGIGVAALSAVVLIATVVGMNNKNKPSGATPSSQPTTSASSNPNISSSSETSSELQIEVPNVASLEIPAGGTTEQTLTAIFGRLNDLLNVGKSEDVFNDYYKNRFSATSKEYAAKYVAPFVDTYLKALCGDNYQSNPNITFLLKDITEQASSHLDLWLSSEQIKKENHTVTATGSAAVIPIFQYNDSLESYESTSSQNDFIVKDLETNNASTIWPNGNFGSGNMTDTNHITLTNEKDDNGNEVVHITGFVLVSQQSS